MNTITRIDEIEDEMAALQERFDVADIHDLVERHDIRIAFKRLVAERKQLEKGDELERLRSENEKLAVDSVALDKIIALIDEDAQCEICTAHDAFELIHDIRKIIDER